MTQLASWVLAQQYRTQAQVMLQLGLGTGRVAVSRDASSEIWSRVWLSICDFVCSRARVFVFPSISQRCAVRSGSGLHLHRARPIGFGAQSAVGPGCTFVVRARSVFRVVCGFIAASVHRESAVCRAPPG